jgi:hypothetical protein
MASRLKYSSCIGLAPVEVLPDVYREDSAGSDCSQSSNRHLGHFGEAVVECRADKTGHKARVFLGSPMIFWGLWLGGSSLETGDDEGADVSTAGVTYGP